MARTVTVTLRGTEWHMPASYRASKEIAEVVGDPLGMAEKITKHFGLKPSERSVLFTLDEMVSIVYIGCKAAGCGLNKDQVGDAIVDAGAADYISIVADYILAICLGGPEKPVQGAGKKKQRSGSTS